jgi:hypothetical protein
VSGIANSLVALCELRAGRGAEVKLALAALEGAPSPFAKVTGTHFARWALVGRLPGRDGKPLPEGPEYLLMCADHDPPLKVWAHALCEQGGVALGSVMSHCTGWPGIDSPDAVSAFLAARNAAPGFTVSTYGQATVPEIRDALSLRARLRALAVATPGLSESELRAQWQQASNP